MEGLSTRDSSALVGRTLGEFVVREPLSAGGFGTVFRAEQPALAREAVIKVLHTRLRASDTLIQRFLREARLASRLDHPFAAHIYAFGAEPDGVLWIAMELVRGTPLDKLLEAQGPVPLERFVPLLERICQVVQTAHDQGIVHRDLKPANVMVLARAGQLLPKLLDLGIAKLDRDDERAGAAAHAIDARITPVDEREASLADTAAPTTGGSTGRLTEDGAVMGSPMYMAPEQWTDAAAVDTRTDIYALGVLSYESLTGKPPFSGINRMAIAMAHARQAPPPLGSAFPPALDGVLARAMAKRPDERYGSALELAAAFRAASGVAEEAIGLPQLPDELRVAVRARAPQPLAQAVAALEAARNAHQARDAIWQLVRVAVRLLGVTALAAHSHVGSGSGASETGLSDALRRLRRRALPDAEWLALARELTRPFAGLRDAYPVPELIDVLRGRAAPLEELLALRDAADGGATDEQVRDLLATAMPLVERLLESLAFLSEYRLVVPATGGAELWMGVARGERPRTGLRGKPLPDGQPALADATGLPVISLWPFLQRHAPTPGAADHLFFFEGKGRHGARLVALPDAFEHEDDALWEALGGLLHEARESERTSSEEVCPYPGLAAFTRGDAGRFFGRERETEAFVNRLRVQPLLAVVGPSGAGKSSFIQAGVVPALPEGWQVVILRPGPAPLLSLTSRLQPLGLDPATLRAELQEHPGALGSMLRTRAGAAKNPLVLVVDQMEELFTLCEDASERALFAEALARAARSADDPVRVVLTLRDDFLLQAEALPALRARLAPALHLLTTPGRDDLLRILSEPLRQAGYELEDPALGGDMVDSLAGARAPLALLSFTASRLWELRDRRFRHIGRKAYQSLGGVGGALAQHAETTLDAMPPDEQRLVREVFRHAVTAEGTRAVLGRAELDQILGGGPHAAAVVEKLVGARLLVASESAAGGEQIEIAHEALLDAWPRLVGWRREDAEGARLRDQLRAAARQWQERGRSTGLLWRGDALAEYRLWRARYPGSLTELENDFAAASLAEAAHGRRRRTLLLAAAFTALAAGVVALLFLNARVAGQRARAEDNQRLAEVNEREAKQSADKLHTLLVRQYQSQGRLLVLGGDPLMGLAYLEKASEMGARGPALDYLVAQAIRATDGVLLQLRHGDRVIRAQFSPDSTRVVTASLDRSANLWDAQTGALLARLDHGDGVVRAEFSRDGSMILTASLDGTATLWRSASGDRLRSFGEPGIALQCALFTARDQRVVTIGADDSVRMWATDTGDPVRILHRGGQPVTGLRGSPCAVSPDGTRLAVGDNRGTARVWQADSGRLLATLSGHGDRIMSVRLSPDGRRVLTASRDGTAALWDLATSRRLATLHHRQAVHAAAFSPDGRAIATASHDHTATIWDAATGQPRLTLTGHDAGVNSVSYSPDGARIATASEDGSAMIWDAASGRRLSRLLSHRSYVDDIVFDGTGGRLVSASGDDSAIIWSAVPQERILHLVGHTGSIEGAAFSPDGRQVVTASLDETARLWNASSGQEILRLRGHRGAIWSTAYAPDGRTLVTGGADGTIRLWDARTGAPLRAMEGHRGKVISVGYDAGGGRIVSAGEDGSAQVWSASTGQRLLSVRGPGAHRMYAAAISPDGAALITAAADATVRVWDLSTGRQLSSRHDPEVLDSLVFDPAGDLVASTTFRKSVKVWRADDGATALELLGHVGDVAAAEWRPDGSFVISGATDGTARLWDVATRETIAVLEAREQVFVSTFSPDGTRVLTAGARGMAMIWELPAYRGSATERQRLLDCRVPFRLENDRVVPRPSTACTSRTP